MSEPISFSRPPELRGISEKLLKQYFSALSLAYSGDIPGSTQALISLFELVSELYSPDQKSGLINFCSDLKSGLSLDDDTKNRHLGLALNFAQELLDSYGITEKISAIVSSTDLSQLSEALYFLSGEYPFTPQQLKDYYNKPQHNRTLALQEAKLKGLKNLGLADFTIPQSLKDFSAKLLALTNKEEIISFLYQTLQSPSGINPVLYPVINKLLSELDSLKGIGDVRLKIQDIFAHDLSAAPIFLTSAKDTTVSDPEYSPDAAQLKDELLFDLSQLLDSIHSAQKSDSPADFQVYYSYANRVASAISSAAHNVRGIGKQIGYIKAVDSKLRELRFNISQSSDLAKLYSACSELYNFVYQAFESHAVSSPRIKRRDLSIGPAKFKESFKQELERIKTLSGSNQRQALYNLLKKCAGYLTLSDAQKKTIEQLILVEGPKLLSSSDIQNKWDFSKPSQHIAAGTDSAVSKVIAGLEQILSDVSFPQAEELLTNQREITRELSNIDSDISKSIAAIEEQRQAPISLWELASIPEQSLNLLADSDKAKLNDFILKLQKIIHAQQAIYRNQMTNVMEAVYSNGTPVFSEDDKNKIASAADKTINEWLSEDFGKRVEPKLLSSDPNVNSAAPLNKRIAELLAELGISHRKEFHSITRDEDDEENTWS